MIYKNNSINYNVHIKFNMQSIRIRFYFIFKDPSRSSNGMSEGSYASRWPLIY